jgi:hypothetical protein
LQNTGELIKLYCGTHLKYHLHESETLKELHHIRENVKQQYLKKVRALYIKKNKIFNDTRDVSKWGFAGSKEELEGRADELLKDKNKAFKFMLSDETKQLNEQREELSFYTNQCLDEVQRTGRDNGELLTDHFITQS